MELEQNGACVCVCVCVSERERERERERESGRHLLWLREGRELGAHATGGPRTQAETVEWRVLRPQKGRNQDGVNVGVMSKTEMGEASQIWGLRNAGSGKVITRGCLENSLYLSE